jgi:hypothetical protein
MIRYRHASPLLCFCNTFFFKDTTFAVQRKLSPDELSKKIKGRKTLYPGYCLPRRYIARYACKTKDEPAMAWEPQPVPTHTHTKKMLGVGGIRAWHLCTDY